MSDIESPCINITTGRYISIDTHHLDYYPYSLASGSSITDCVYMDISIQGKPEGRLVLGLHGSSVPRASLNFLELGEELSW